MTRRPQVSVVLPTFNRASLLPETLATLLGQRFEREYELIVMDDGSTDATPVLMRDYCAPVRYERREHGGLPGIINEGICLARGEYVMLCNDHDLYEDDMLASLASTLDGNPGASLAVPDVVLVDPSAQRELDSFKLSFGGLVEGQRFTAEQLLPGIGSIAPANMWRAACLNGELLDESYGAAADVELWLRLASRGDVMHVPRSLVRMRARDELSALFHRNHEIVAATLRAKRAYLSVVPTERRAEIERSWRPLVDRSAATAMLRALAGGRVETIPEIATLARAEGSRSGGIALGVLGHMPNPVALSALRMLASGVGWWRARR